MKTHPSRDRPEFASPRVGRERLADGGFILRSLDALGPYEDHVCAYLERWAREAPERAFLAERGGDGNWVELTYAKARAQARAIAHSLIERGVTPEHPVMILSDNSIANAMMQLGAMYAGVPAVPVSPAYSLMSRDFAKLKHIHALVAPNMIFAADGAMFANALDALALEDTHVVVCGDAPDRFSAIGFDALTRATPGAEVERALSAVGPDTVAKILFTSGSTGLPKGVINTHRMLCSNQQAIAQMWPFVEKRPPVMVDWLPWNHTFGGNHDFNLILRNGGTLYIDGGKPAPGIIGKTIQNLRDVSPTLYFNVPRGFEMVLPHLEADDGFRDHFFANLDLVFYAAAALPQDLWSRLENLSLAARGDRIVMTSAWGSTETAPLASSAHFALDRAGVIGVPAPGTEIKMVPNGSKLEMRVRGPNVTPGYFRRDDLTADAFDADGFYKTGDAGRLEDEDDPAKGIVFDGRVAEDFKLSTGTWVNTGQVRIAAVSAGAPIIQDAVITGHDRNEIGLLVFANPAGCAAVTGRSAETPLGELISEAALRRALADRLQAYNESNPASSTRIARVLLLDTPADIDANEITDKGYINQRAVLERRAEQVAMLYSHDPRVIRLDRG